ncbi:capsular exopolysaccharide synthesis family protein [Geodermatophilus normandii]|uniref:Capsular exopolysaccharide synthesis family protein n=1 Tax=Geodermatophilus normandii TaxID=1137989 RepID=A0A317QGS7_9ACTN|nr:capsular exopolysaccharide synthesis family protein [Geodermatophilus normandii]
MFAALRTNWWMPLVGALLGACASVAYCLTTTPVYSAETQFFIASTETSTSSEAFQGGQFSQQRVASYAQLLSGEELAGRVNDRLGLDEDVEELAARITAIPVADTVLINVIVDDPSPQQARQIAEAVGDEFTVLVTDLETPNGGGQAPVKATVTEDPKEPTSPSWPDIPRIVAIATLGCLVLGAAAAVLRRQLDRTVKSADTASGLGGAPVVGTVLRDTTLGLRHVYDQRSPNRAAEDYRQLRTALQFLSVDNPPRVIMVTSAMPTEGKTTVAINLAVALAESGRQVTLLDADLRRPRVAGYLGLVGGVGLTNVLAGSAEAAEVEQVFGTEGLKVIGAGPTPPNPNELLSSRQMFSLVDQLRESNDFVLIDAPPVLPVADAAGLGVLADGVLVSVRHGHTRKDQLQQATATLERVGARILGVVLNIVPLSARAAQAYGYGTDYVQDAQPRTRKRADPHRSSSRSAARSQALTPVTDPEGRRGRPGRA